MISSISPLALFTDYSQSFTALFCAVQAVRRVSVNLLVEHIAENPCDWRSSFLRCEIMHEVPASNEMAGVSPNSFTFGGDGT